MLFLGARCCCDCRSLAVLVILSLGKPVLFAAAVTVLASTVCCRSLAVLVLSTAAAAVFIIAVLVIHSLGIRFCCCCRSFAVLMMLYRINLVLSSAAASI
ncbi:hypothetical protein MAM1_0295d09357 [Mucor ambiguus]|uniref:Uncharacterized protein n=1 Tax=Mucor ambiguus TaxID=91626 RepID=A0A0C9MQV9_9FUNG|nr:hypothetical protein MAM1_0295d09357 [Mucor ambiguus]